jgi:hypothetical protein
MALEQPARKERRSRRQLLFFRSFFVVALWILALILVVALTLSDDPVEELRQQAARWAEQQPLHYRYTLNSDRPGASLVLTIDVEDGRASYPRFTDEANFPLPEDPSAYTIDWLFAEIEAALDQGAEITHSRYDRQYGFPSTVSLDYPGVADSWASYNVFDFELLDEGRGR